MGHKKIVLFLCVVLLSVSTQVWSADTIFLPASFTGDIAAFQDIYGGGDTPVSTTNPGDTFRVTFSVSAGVIQITTTTGLSEVTGYPQANWTNGLATEIAFTGSLADVNNAAASLQYKGGASVLTASVLNISAGGDASYYAATGSFYKFVPGSISWTTARAAANSSYLNGMQGYLATVTSADEFDFIKSKTGGTEAWLGGTDQDVEGEWRWIDDPGVPADESGVLFWLGRAANYAIPGSAQNGMYTAWNTGEPNDAGNEDALQIISSGSWNDLPVTGYSIGGYVIEYTPSASSGSLATLNISSATAPTISNLSPVDNSTTVTLDANLVITFSEAIASGSGNITIYKSSDDTVFESINVTSGAVAVSGSQVTINPTGTFAEGTSYYVFIDATAFQSVDDSAYFAGISSPATYNFTTLSAPTLSSSSPADNATDVSINTNIVLNFSDNVDAETGSIEIRKTSDDSLVETIAVGSAQVTGSGSNAITIDPSATFDAGTEYYVLIDATAFDSTAGLSFAGISDTTALSFTTSADVTSPTMVITAAEVQDGASSDNASLAVTFTASEPTSDFSAADITVSNGVITDFTAISTTVYTATFTPQSAGATTIDVAAGAFHDAATNANVAAVQFNWTYGSDPTKKADVVDSVKAMSNMASRFAGSSMRAVNRRMSWLNQNRNSEEKSRQGIEFTFANPHLNGYFNGTSVDLPGLLSAYDSDVDGSMQDYAAKLAMEQAREKFGVVNLNPTGGTVIGDWSIWTEGNITIGKAEGFSGSELDSESFTITAGMDRPVGDSGLFGVSLTYGQDEVDIGSVGSGLDSDNYAVSGYGYFKPENMPQMEAVLGLGSMKIDTLRVDGSQTLRGDRDAKILFGSFTARKDTMNYRDFSLSPYARLEGAYIRLDDYAEAGGNLALAYEEQTVKQAMVFFGTEVISQRFFSGGKLRPFGKVEYGLNLTGDSNADMHYVGDTTNYRLVLDKDATSMWLLQVGADYQIKDDLNVSFSFDHSEAVGSGHTDTLRLELNINL